MSIAFGGQYAPVSVGGITDFTCSGVPVRPPCHEALIQMGGYVFRFDAVDALRASVMLLQLPRASRNAIAGSTRDRGGMENLPMRWSRRSELGAQAIRRGTTIEARS